jgi:hypothetical protein
MKAACTTYHYVGPLNARRPLLGAQPSLESSYGTRPSDKFLLQRQHGYFGLADED